MRGIPRFGAGVPPSKGFPRFEASTGCLRAGANLRFEAHGRQPNDLTTLNRLSRASTASATGSEEGFWAPLRMATLLCMCSFSQAVEPVGPRMRPAPTAASFRGRHGRCQSRSYPNLHSPSERLRRKVAIRAVRRCLSLGRRAAFREPLKERIFWRVEVFGGVEHAWRFHAIEFSHVR